MVMLFYFRRPWHAGTLPDACVTLRWGSQMSMMRWCSVELMTSSTLRTRSWRV